MTDQERAVAVSPENMERFLDFLEMIACQTYPEAPSEPHHSVTEIMLEQILRSTRLPKPGRILDVGCGQGPALDFIRNRGYHAVGITINDEDLNVCRSKGHEVHKMDQSFLDFPDSSFDLVWARHCVEHSIMPFFTLAGFHRILRPGGFLYLEVPAPDTSCHHERNANHYSVLTNSTWQSLVKRSGFAMTWQDDFTFTPPSGPDTYFMFFCQKTGDGSR
jgi:SAM-dependent methyltransferase